MMDLGITDGDPGLATVLLNESPDALFALSLDGKVLSWNRGAEALFGFEAKDAVGQPLERLVIPEEGRQDAQRALRLAAEKGAFLVEVLRRKKDGSVVYVD